MVSYQSMDIPQFFPAARMDLYQPFNQMSLWELDTVKGDTTTADNKLKVQRRLAQNREAARKSRLRRKAYVQQLETSRLKLAQLELELQYEGIGATFELQYGNWIEQLQRKTSELKNLLQSQYTDAELELLVGNALNHCYRLFRMKAEVAKANVFSLISGTWRTPVERLYLWIGGFRPSDLIKVVMPRLGPLTDQQRVEVDSQQSCCKHAEDALSQGMDKLHQKIAQNISAGAGTYSTWMASSAMEDLESLQNFAIQADNIRQQALLQMSRILTTRQTAQALLALAEYFQNLRALSSLWAARP